MRTNIFLIASLLLVSGCASLPDMTYNYYSAQGTARVEVVRTFDCSTDKTRLVMVTAPPSVKSEYSANYTKGQIPLNPRGSAGDLSDLDFTIAFYEDGRLKSINSETTGQGEKIVQAVLGVAKAAVGFVGGGADEATVLSECTALADWGKGKPVSITFSKELELSRANTSLVNLDPAPEIMSLFHRLNQSSPQARLSLESAPLQPASLANGDMTDYLTLNLQKVYPATIEVLIDGTPIWDGATLVPTDETYQIPLPQAGAFGTTKFAITVAESGAVTSLTYARGSGAAAAANSAAGVLNGVSQSAAERAAELEAEADVIAQSQRLARCRAQPENCE